EFCATFIVDERVKSRDRAPKAPNVIAWGNAPGKSRDEQRSAVGAKSYSPNSIPRFQRLETDTHVVLGRWPRLLHFAPLALKNKALTGQRTPKGNLLMHTS